MSFEFEASNGLEQRLRQARAEVERRVRSGEVHVAEQLLTRTPDMATDADFALELIYTEFVVLEELGAKPSLEETLSRYPQWQGQLERLLKVHEVLSETEDIDLSATAETLVGFESTDDHRQTADGTRWGGTIGQYELLEEVGRGGMGLVYRARQRGLNRMVAVKLIRSADTATTSERSRFRVEAEAAATLQHPNIVQIYEVGNHQGCDFLSMEYVEGGSLEDHLQHQRFSIHDAATLIATLAEAIHTAHEHGIVHRDLKPGNILLAGDVPKISDFGLAKQLWSSPTDHTQSGTLLGTPCYMSPEQAAGRTSETSAAADIYALGAILYELLVHRPPFLGETTIETLDWIRTRDPERPSTIDPKLPRDLETISLKCLAKDPRGRYASAQELADDLYRFLNHEPIRARPVSWWERGWRWVRRHPAWVGMIGLLLVVTAASAMAIFFQRRIVGELSRSAAKRQLEADKEERRAEAAIAVADLNRREAADAIDRLSRLGASLNEQPGMGLTALQTAEEAARQYETLLQQDGTDEHLQWQAAQTYERIGYIQLRKGQPDLAAASTQKAITIYDGLPSSILVKQRQALAQVTLGHSLRRVEAWDASETAYNTAVAILESLEALHPGTSGYRIHLANTLLNSTIGMRRDGRFDEAIRTYIRAVRLIRVEVERALNQPTSSTLPGPCLASPEDLAEVAYQEVLLADEALQQVMATSKAAQTELADRRLFTEMALVLDELAIALTDMQQTERAATAMSLALDLRQLALDLAPSQHWRKQYLGRSYQRRGDHLYQLAAFADAAAAYEQAISLYSELMDAFPSRVPYRIELGQLHSSLGKAHRQLGNFQAARVSLHKSVQLHERLVQDESMAPTSQADRTDRLLRLGRAYSDCGRFEDAMTTYREALEATPTSARAMNRIAWLQLTAADHSMRDPARALELAQQAVERAPENASYWNTLGVAYYRNGQWEQASQILLQAVAQHHEGGTPFDWYFLAMSHAQLGNWQEAGEWRDRAKSWTADQRAIPPDLKRFQEECREVFTALAPSQSR